MSRQERRNSGQFAAKSDDFRQVRSIRATDTAWEKLGKVAEERGMTRADLIERLVESGGLDNQIDGGISLQQVEEVVAQILNDPAVTRNGKDRGSVRRALEALLRTLHPRVLHGKI